MITRLSLTLFLLLAAVTGVFAQANTYKFDENTLTLWPGSFTVSDASAEGGTAIVRPSSAGNGTVWFGPYTHINGGNYIVQARMKVGSNAGSSTLLYVDVFSGSTTYGRIDIKPNMFRNSLEWQLISIPVTIPNDKTNIEIRGMEFISSGNDIYLDYLTLIPGDARGYYSNEFTVSGNGNVGIGNLFPNEKLAVNGVIRSREIKVETANWPDYVFKADHQLPELKDVETYIKANSHLPEIPSAEEVGKSGVSLGEMNAKLLKKIEELTLYVIEQNKRLADQENKIKVLEAKVQ